MKINPKTQQFQFFLQILDDFKQEKIKFITKIQSTNEDKSLVQISQSPVHVDSGCSYFLLNAYCGVMGNNRQYSGGYGNVNGTEKNNKNMGLMNRQHNQSQATITTTKQLLFNLLYMISHWLYIPKQTLHQFTSLINKQSRNCLSHINKLFIVNFEHIHTNNSYAMMTAVNNKKQLSARISTTAAQTKAAYQHQSIQNEMFFDEQMSLHDRLNSNNGKLSSTPKSTRLNNKNIQDKRRQSSLRSPLTLSSNMQNNQHRQKMFFSRIQYLQATQQNVTQKILQQIVSISSSLYVQSNNNINNINNFSLQQQQYFNYQSLKQLFEKLQQSHTLMTLQQFHHVNTQSINFKIIQNLFANYTFALQQQYNFMDEKSIDQIKQLLDKLYLNLINQFYQSFSFIQNNNINEQQCMDKLLSLVNDTQKSLFSSINKSKKEMFERKLCVVDDIIVSENRWDGRRTKFQSLMGERLVEDQQIGFGLYRKSIKNKLSDIFSDLLDESNKKPLHTHHKSLPNATNTSKLISRHALTNNMDKRIQILLSQKRNLQQSLHYQQRLQQNLIQYINGQSSYQQQISQRRQIQTISESQQDVQ